MEAIFNYLTSNSNYKAINMPNLFNTFYAIIQMDPDRYNDIMNIITINMGVTIKNQFIVYLTRKNLTTNNI